MANVYARMNDGDNALTCLSLLARSCVMNNFYTTHNDWRNSGIGMEMDIVPYQIDANLGWTAAMQEMLLFSVPGRVTLLPALPGAWPKGTIKGLLARGGIEVSIEWDAGGTQVAASLMSRGKPQTVTVEIGTKVIGVFDLCADRVEPIEFASPLVPLEESKQSLKSCSKALVGGPPFGKPCQRVAALEIAEVSVLWHPEGRDSQSCRRPNGPVGVEHEKFAPPLRHMTRPIEFA